MFAVVHWWGVDWRSGRVLLMRDWEALVLLCRMPMAIQITTAIFS